jgi:ferric-dicitrate binding protein FerR (iron transport regulator)
MQATKAPDLDREWKTLQSKIAQAPSPNIKIEPGQSSINSLSRRFSFSPAWMLRAAAILILLLIPAWFLVRYALQPEMMVITASENVQTVTLPDGSLVTMRKGSVIEFPEEFSRRQRTVNLSGEAFFEVIKDAAKPFLVSSGNSRTEVTGTTFSVHTDNVKQVTEVILASGSVIVSFESKPDEGVLLSPGEKAVLSESASTIEKSINSDPNFLAWKTHVIRFDNTALPDAFKVLTHVYGAGFRLSGGTFENCRITATFEHQSLESILNVFKATLNLQLNQRADGWEITGKGCDK